MKSIIAIFVIISLLSIGCDSPKDYTLSPEVLKYISDSFSLPKDISAKYKIVSVKIRANKVLMIGLNSFSNSYFLIADLKSKKIDYIIKNTVDKYNTTLWDFDSNTVIAAPSQQFYNLNFFNLFTNINSKKVFDSTASLFSDDIIANGNQLFFTGGVYGSAIFNINNSKILLFKTTAKTMDPLSSTISFPLDDSLNLLSGNITSKDSLEFYAIDNKDNIKWTYNVAALSQMDNSVNILNESKNFITKSFHSLTCLDKKDGKVTWKKDIAEPTNEVYKVGDKILLYSIINKEGTLPDKDDFKYKVILKLLNSSDGNEMWITNLTSINIPHLAICNDKLFLSDNVSFNIYSLSDGKALIHYDFEMKFKNNFAFEILPDIKSGKYYLKSYNNVIYW